MDLETLEQKQSMLNTQQQILADTWKHLFNLIDLDKQVVKNINLGYMLDQPFDTQSCVALTATPFGYLGSGELIGRYVRIKNSEDIIMDFGIWNAELMPELQDLISNIKLNGLIGCIVGHANSRVVVYTPQGYYGWLDDSQWELVHIHHTLTDDFAVVTIQ
jgi:hypothetical protein